MVGLAGTPPVPTHPNDVLARLLLAAHRVPSVGFSQPWDFLLVRDPKTRGRVRELFEKARRAEAGLFDEPRRFGYLSLRLDSLSSAPLHLCVTCDPTRGGPRVVNSATTPEAGLYSACLAVENLWLAARAEGVGVGVDWVSLLDRAELREVLGIPPARRPRGLPVFGLPERRVPRGAAARKRRVGRTLAPTFAGQLRGVGPAGPRGLGRAGGDPRPARPNHDRRALNGRKRPVKRVMSTAASDSEAERKRLYDGACDPRRRGPGGRRPRDPPPPAGMIGPDDRGTCSSLPLALFTRVRGRGLLRSSHSSGLLPTSASGVCPSPAYTTRPTGSRPPLLCPLGDYFLTILTASAMT